jgi:hypothetical protein
LLAIEVGEGRPFSRDTVDVGSLIAHHAPTKVADVPYANIVSPNDENVGLISLGHFESPPVGIAISGVVQV